MDCDFVTDASRHSVTNDILTQNRGSQSGEPNSGVARKLRGRETSQYIFFAHSWGCCKILNGFAMAATSGMQSPHQIVSATLKDQTAREMLQVFRRYDGSTGKSVDDLFSSLAQLFKGRLTLTGVKF